MVAQEVGHRPFQEHPRLIEAGVIWIFLAVMIGMFTVVLSMAEMASMYVVIHIPSLRES